MERPSKQDKSSEQTAAQKADNTAATPVSADKTIITPKQPTQAQAVQATDKPAERTPPEQMGTLEGKVIKGRYKVESLVGQGGMSDVYRAKDLLLEAAGVVDPFVALKVLQKQFLSQPEARQILVREARKTQQLSHPNIIRVYDFGVDKHVHYLVMEWLDGETLEEVIKRSRPLGLPFKGSMKLLNQIGNALQFAHSQGVVHADLKPANIMLTRDGAIKIFDFGVSRALNINADQYAADTHYETSPLSGYTPAYASPNLLKGKEPNIKDDVFAFSCIAYELLSSKHPFDRKPADKAAKANLKASKPKHISPLNWLSLRNGLSFEDATRSASIELLCSQLNRRYWPLAASAASVMLVACIGAYAYQSKQHELENISATMQSMHLEQQQDQLLSQLPAKELVGVIETLPVEKALLKDGLLRSKRVEVLSMFEKRIDAILNNRESTYPDYYAIQRELQAVQALYPDSDSLARLSVDVHQGWQSTVDVLDERLNKLLEMGRYAQREDGDDIYQINQDLKVLKRDHKFYPSQKTEEVFTSTFNKALLEHDVVTLNQMINAGELLFADNEALSELLAYGSQLKVSVAQMSDYQEQQQQGQQPRFPYKAAEIFYANTFDGFSQRLEQLDSVSKLDKLAGDVDQLSDELPGDFADLVNIRREMANRYLSFSDALLKKRKVKSAQSVMKKANKLFAQLQNQRVTL